MIKIKQAHLHFTSLLILCLLLIGCSDVAPISEKPNNAIEDTTPSPGVTQQELPFTAEFQIVTNGTVRIFTDAKYHKQSVDVYIDLPNPNLIVINKPGITWDDFFGTLPFSLRKDCLITGTKQTFCTTDRKKLYFYLNGQEVPEVLDRVIEPGDVLSVEYK